ncbi:MAG: hypothetical protein Sapg2KO_34050 [Saprospiraceae bacterium]
MRTRLTILLTVFLTAVSLAQQAAIIPLTLQHNYIFIELRINNSEPLNFMFDTGAGVTVIDTAAARRLDLAIAGKARIRTSGGTIQSSTSKNNQIRIKDFIVNKVALEIMPIGHLAAYLDYPLDGIIGYDLLNRFGVEINIDQSQFKIFRGNTKRLNLKKGEVVKMHQLPYGLFGIKMLLQADKNGEIAEVLLKIDSGFEDALNLHGQTVDKYKLLENRRTKIAEGMSADPTITRNYSAKMHQLSFAAAKWKKVATVLTVDPLNVQATKQDVAQGFIGQELLLGFNILYDMPNSRIVFQKRN